MKKIIYLMLSSLLILGACGNSEDNSNKGEQKQKSDNQKNEDKVESTNNENQNNQKQSSQEKSNQNIDLSNIQDRNTLESIIYGNYTEEQKVQAYKSAVANGVIPQGNVMQGPASEAYESSLRVESGQEKSIYYNSSSSNSSSGTDAGMIDYDEVDRILEENRQEAENYQSNGPRSLREIKEDTGKGASEFTQEEIDEANEYARQH
ncbi:hypothetical protein [Staphylococcus epidermidis]|uniref:hypothetical protein n=2 Tax=Staphylococcus epidermidis TaxID=1282 RepID=UPI0011A82E7A|nr:hypothetical protein [Staphylococcus epidermidis]